MLKLATLFLGILVIAGGAMSDHVPLSSLLNVTAFIIVICGSCAACLLQFGLKKLLAGIKAVMWLAKPPTIDLTAFIDSVVAWATKARSSGVLSLESDVQTVTDPLQRQGLQMLVDNTPPEEFAAMLAVMTEKIDLEQEMHAQVWEALGGYSPTIGVLGAVMGLIHVMMELNHPELLGGGIATAFIATVYGVGFANLIALPLGGRLKTIAKELERERMVVIQGFILLGEGKPGLLIRQTLSNYLESDTTPTKTKDKETSQEVPDGASQAA